MKNVRIIIYGVLLVAFIGCASSPKLNNESVIPPEVKNVPDVKITCLATMNTQPNTSIKSVDDGIIQVEYSELPGEFIDSIVIETTREYYMDGKTKNSKFQLIYSGVNRTIESINIKNNFELGLATGTSVSICARSLDLDPYLVACSDVVPIYKNGYWYYFPGMYVSSQMKWLSFKPAEYESFKSMYDHATNGEEALGLTKFNWWVLYKTSLSEYPTPMNNEMSTQVIYFYDIPLRLNYQKSFLKYLQDEYILGTPIYLYLQIYGINGFDKEYKCYVRDFSLVPPEEIVNKRIEHIRGIK